MAMLILTLVAPFHISCQFELRKILFSIHESSLRAVSWEAGPADPGSWRLLDQYTNIARLLEPRDDVRGASFR